MIKTDDGEYVVELLLTSFSTDPVQYKPYSPQFTPNDCVLVRVPLDSEYIIEEDENEDGQVLIISLDGLMALLRTVADSIEGMHDKRQSRNVRQYNRRS